MSDQQNSAEDLSQAVTQLYLRRRITQLEAMQCQRLALVVEQKKALDAVVERADRELENLRAQVTIRITEK